MISVILIQDSPYSKLRENLENNSHINLISVSGTDRLTHVRAVTSVPEKFVVINLDAVERKATVETGLLLRNKGYQVFISCDVDFSDLIEIMTDTYEYIKGKMNQGSPIQTELIVTEHALTILGDITSIIEGFEATHKPQNGHVE